jgi:hypothetical protein
MRTPLALIAVAAAFSPAAAEAGGALSDEIGLSTSPGAGSQPKTGVATNALRGSWDLSEQWTLKLGCDLSRTVPSASDIAPKLRPRAETSITIIPGIAYAPDEHVSLELDGSLSPRSTTEADSSFKITTDQGTGEATALITSVTSTYGGSFWLGYDTAGEGDFETSLSLSLAGTHFSTTEQITALEGPNGGVLGPAALAQFCRTHRCSAQRKALLGQHPDSLGQLSVGASATETLWQDSDVAATFTYYLYSDDPTQIGYFNLASAGRTVSFGSGLPIAPPLWSLRPDLAHRFGPVLVDLAYQHTQYVAAEGSSDLLGLRIQVKLGKAVKIWASGSAQRDRDWEGKVAPAGAISAGVKVRW